MRRQHPQPMCQHQHARPMNWEVDSMLVPPALSAEMFLYVDETTFNSPDGVRMIGVGVLVSPEPIAADLVTAALEHLAVDPDRHDPNTKTLDDGTLSRGHFHASEDSKNAHSWLARQIHARVKGQLLLATTTSRGKGSEADYRHQSLQSLVSALKTKRPVLIVFEARSGFSKESAAGVVETLYRGLDQSAYGLPLLPTYYPQVSVLVQPKSNPGLQVADLLIWAAVQKAFYPSKPKARVFHWCGLGFHIQASIGALAQQWTRYQLNGGDRTLQAEEAAAIRGYPVEHSEIEQPRDATESANLYCIGERLIHWVATTAETQPSHAQHVVNEASQLSIRLRQQPTTAELIHSVARVFIRLFDTIPVYTGRDRAEFIQLVKARRFLALALRQDMLHGVATGDFLVSFRDANVHTNPSLFGLARASR